MTELERALVQAQNALTQSDAEKEALLESIRKCKAEIDQYKYHNLRYHQLTQAILDTKFYQTAVKAYKILLFKTKKEEKV